jgi:putative ABC transport system permease protein
MFKSFYTAVIYAVENIRTNFFHTLLSVIGITIGVSALIIILSMIDGLEKYAEDQISSTTAIKVVEISSRTTESLDSIAIRKEQPVILTEQIHRELISNIDVPFTTYRVSEAARQVSAGDQQIGAQIYFSDPGYADYYILEYGTHLFETESNPGERQVAVVSSLLAERIAGELFEAETLIGTELTVNDMQYDIIGIVRGIAQNPEILIPIDYLTGQELLNHPPFIAIQADEIADVPKVRDAVH